MSTETASKADLTKENFFAIHSFCNIILTCCEDLDTLGADEAEKFAQPNSIIVSGQGEDRSIVINPVDR